MKSAPSRILSFNLAVMVSLAASVAFGRDVPLRTDLPFDTPATMSKQSITLVIAEDLEHMVFKKKMRLAGFNFPIGDSVAANAERALKTRFAKVVRAKSSAEARTNLVLEARAYEVMPRLPKTTFGTYSAKVKLDFTLRNTKDKSSRDLSVLGDGGNRKEAALVLWDAGWRNTDWQQMGKATDLAVIDALYKLLDEIAR